MLIQAAESMEDPAIGWCYIDQSAYIPALHGLVELRDTMVKRTCISTLEVVLKTAQVVLCAPTF